MAVADAVTDEEIDTKRADDALSAIADQALARGTGARGLRAILEEVLLGVMYELPSRDDVATVRIDDRVVVERAEPTLVLRDAPKAGRSRRAAS